MPRDLYSTLAETGVTRLVFRWMEKARAMQRPIMISGNSRLGKTEAVKLLCDMEPGNYRMVNTPASNAIGDLFREVGKVPGIEIAALPAIYSRNTAPARLNWVRRSIIDQKIAAVFV